MKNVGKIQRETNLRAEPWTPDIPASEQTEIKGHAVAKQVLSPHQSLELASAQILAVCKPTVKLTA